MWSKRTQDHDLRVLLSKIDCAPEPTRDLVADVLHHACPRLKASLTPNDLVVRLIEAEAWVELGLWLIGWELPDWDVHQLSRGDHSWNCSICVRGLARNWVERRRRLSARQPPPGDPRRPRGRAAAEGRGTGSEQRHRLSTARAGCSSARNQSPLGALTCSVSPQVGRDARHSPDRAPARRGNGATSRPRTPRRSGS